MPSQPFGTSPEDVLRYYDDALRMLREVVETWAAGPVGERQSMALGGIPESAYGNLMTFMQRAYVAYMRSGFRSWTRFAELSGQYSLTISARLMEMTRASGRNEEAQRVLLDTMRAYVREALEFPMQESRRLQAEIDTIAAELWPLEQDQNKEPRRRHAKAKT